MSDTENILAESASVAVFQKGDQVIVARRGTGGWSTAAFVFGLMTLFGTVGTYVMWNDSTGDPETKWIPTLVTGVAGLVGGAGLGWALHVLRSRRGLPLAQLSAVVILDGTRRLVCDGGGNPLAPFDGVRLNRRMQVTSSYRALHLEWEGGSICVARGTPFAGTVGPIESVLQHMLGRG